MRSSVAMLLASALIASPAFASRVHQAPTSGQSHHSHKSAAASSAPKSGSHSTAKGAHVVQTSVKSHRMHGQQGIDSERATQIQQALIREHYLTGEASGHWDSETAAAMQKFQADQGWQTKLMPDSRALKKLGLGPDYSNAINAKTGNFIDPPPVSSIPPENVAGFTAGSGVKD